MRQLVIEYLLEGVHRGYAFTSPTQGVPEETLRTIWRLAMPRGQGWGGTVYAGSLALKGFAAGEHTAALSQVTVTDQQDEIGRRGIRRVVIWLMSPDECVLHLRQRLDSLYRELLARGVVTPRQWAKLGDSLTHRLRGKNQVILSHPYQTPAHWKMVEALVLRLSLTHQGPDTCWNKFVPFTTLALDARDESRLVAVPAQHAAQLHGVFPVRF